ncbi:class I lanthipeptide [Taibaiella chishuiensis]|uniref:Uncharacterized protein n=1 Tax=Taibaiella chishuiensis TaxID=1434707 RepID=A0A2P8D637_9BACT|nr:class I lanthipeptide [Taibaiella chishuiensis]PSK92662.1 hypothetical protein B0I18_103239 [Taibaiella chishuiensis]
MKKKKTATRLSLQKKTITLLNKQAMQRLAGGADTERNCPFETRFQDCLTQYFTRCGNSCD